MRELNNCTARRILNVSTRSYLYERFSIYNTAAEAVDKILGGKKMENLYSDNLNDRPSPAPNHNTETPSRLDQLEDTVYRKGGIKALRQRVKKLESDFEEIEEILKTIAAQQPKWWGGAAKKALPKAIDLISAIIRSKK